MIAKNSGSPYNFLPNRPIFSINAKGRLLELEKPLIMGILNITPDSFYKESRYPQAETYLFKAEQMLEEGAAILDIGGQSTRPRATLLTAEEEMKRVLPAIDEVLKRFPQAIISIDTFYAKVARAAIEHGASLINDISAGDMDPAMITIAGHLQVPYIAMHMQGTPATMQDNPRYEDVVREVLDYFIQKAAACKAAGIHDLIIDPGFGFGKTVEHNYVLLKHLETFHILGLPLLVGLSRKSAVCRLLHVKPAEALNGTTALHLLALQKGVHLLRVHDVKPAKEVIRIWEYYLQQR